MLPALYAASVDTLTTLWLGEYLKLMESPRVISFGEHASSNQSFQANSTVAV
jgi:hypothetical protein